MTFLAEFEPATKREKERKKNGLKNFRAVFLKERKIILLRSVWKLLPQKQFLFNNFVMLISLEREFFFFNY
jgi:hypothetical protein